MIQGVWLRNDFFISEVDDVVKIAVYGRMIGYVRLSFIGDCLGISVGEDAFIVGGFGTFRIVITALGL